jgi:predicted aldo/keto reductase-like oxidoreductase
MPLSLTNPKANVKKNQHVSGKWYTPIEAARQLGLFVTTSAPFEQGQAFTKQKNIKQLLGYLLGNKGILAVMAGMKQTEHVKENILVLESLNYSHFHFV